MPNLYIIAGPNGAGKTTASYTILPELLNCNEFVNADEIAKGISPFNPESVAFESGRIMLTRLDQLLETGTDFAFETTLSTRSYMSFIKKAKERGYKISLLFFWLNSAETAKERVKHRVLHGGHNIPVEIIERRYKRGLKNLFDIYLKLTDYWVFLDNTKEPLIIAEGTNTIDFNINNPDLWNSITDGQ